MEKIHVTVISLDKNSERFRRVDSQLTKHGIEYVWLPAVDGRDRPASSFPRYNDARAHRILGRPLLGGELGCYESHIAAIEQFLATEAEAGLVLEDDIVVAPGAAEFVGHLVDWLPERMPDWEIVNLGLVPRKLFRAVSAIGNKTRLRGYRRAGRKDGVVDEIGKRSLLRAFYFPMSAYALLWSRAGASRFLRAQGEISVEIDRTLVYYFTKRGTGLAVDVPVIAHSDIDSDIDGLENARGDFGKLTKTRQKIAKFFGSAYLKSHAIRNMYLRQVGL